MTNNPELHTKPLTAKQLLQDFARDYTECKTADQIETTIKGYEATLNAWQNAAAAKERKSVVVTIYSIANDLATQDPKALGAVSLAPYMSNAVAIYSEFLKGDNYELIDWKELNLRTLKALQAWRDAGRK